MSLRGDRVVVRVHGRLGPGARRARDGEDRRIPQSKDLSRESHRV